MVRSQAAAVPLIYRAAYSASAMEPHTVGIRQLMLYKVPFIVSSFVFPR